MCVLAENGLHLSFVNHVEAVGSGIAHLLYTVAFLAAAGVFQAYALEHGFTVDVDHLRDIEVIVDMHLLAFASNGVGNEVSEGEITE